MGRFAALLALTLVPLAACEDISPCDQVSASFALTAPNGATELIPGRNVRLSWEPIDVQSAVVAFLLLDGDRVVPVGGGETRLGTHEFSMDSNGQPVAPAVYRIRAIFGGCALSSPAYEAGATRLVYAQGVTFADTSLTITAAQTPRDIAFTTVSLSSLQLELLVDPSPTTDGDELIFASNTVPGELVAMTRRYAFTGMTTTGAAIPGGTYRVVGRVRALDDTVVYDIPGPQLTWTP